MQTRYIAVVHNWFVSSEGFHVEELDATDRKQAEAEAAILYRRHNRPFSKADVKLIELQKGERIAPRKRFGEKLTLWERMTGRVARNHTGADQVSHDSGQQGE